MNLKLSPFFS